MTPTTSAQDRVSEPIEEWTAATLERAGFDESDRTNIVDALKPLLRDYERVERERDGAVAAIQDAVLLIGSFDPTSGTGRSATFAADLEHILRGRP